MMKKNSSNNSEWNSVGINKYTNTKYNKQGYNQNGYDLRGYDRNGLDQNGYDTSGWNKEGKNKYTQTVYDKCGYDKCGYDNEGYDKGGYDNEGYDNKGYNKKGYDQEGYNKKGYSFKGYDREGYDKNGWNVLGINRKTRSKYDESGFKLNGYDEEGFDKSGFNKNNINRNGFNREGFGLSNKAFYKNNKNQIIQLGDLVKYLPRKDLGLCKIIEITNQKKCILKIRGVTFKNILIDDIEFCFDKNGIDNEGFNEYGWNINGINKKTNSEFDENGYDQNGWNELGWNIEDKNKHTHSMFDKEGYNRLGFDKNGWNINGINQLTKTSFDEYGYDVNGWNEADWNKKGINKYTHNKYNKKGYDIDGNHISKYINGLKSDKTNYIDKQENINSNKTIDEQIKKKEAFGNNYDKDELSNWVTSDKKSEIICTKNHTNENIEKKINVITNNNHIQTLEKTSNEDTKREESNIEHNKKSNHILGWGIGILLFLFINSFIQSTCHDGWSSPSIGMQGACSHHGGVDSKGGLRLLALLFSAYIGYMSSSINFQYYLKKYIAGIMILPFLGMVVYSYNKGDPLADILIMFLPLIPVLVVGLLIYIYYWLKDNLFK